MGGYRKLRVLELLQKYNLVDGKSTPCGLCGHEPGKEVNRNPSEMKRLETSIVVSEEMKETGGGDPLHISIKENMLEELKRDVSNDAAFVLEKLLENPQKVGEKLAAFLRLENEPEIKM